MTGAPAAIELIDGVPVGWCLGQSSWATHRAFYRQTGRTMVFREYSRLMCARGPDAKCLSRSRNIWRLRGDLGECVVVRRSRHVIREILPADWTAPPAKPTPKKHAKPSPPPTSAPKPRPTAHDLRARLGLPVV